MCLLPRKSHSGVLRRSFEYQQQYTLVTFLYIRYRASVYLVGCRRLATPAKQLPQMTPPEA